MTESEQFKQIVCTMYDTFCKKNHDYGNSFSTTWQEFGSLGLVTAVTQISHKYHRLLNLTKGTQSKAMRASATRCWIWPIIASSPSWSLIRKRRRIAFEIKTAAK